MPLFALVDCNNFYASCERVFNPKLAGKPVVVLGNNDGIVVARSNEAKAFGIPMGVPAFKYRDLFRRHDVQAFSSNYVLYGDMSQRVMETLQQFSPELEVYSIDEAFLSFAGFTSVSLTDYGHRIRATVKQWTGIPVSVGIAETKTLAKIANYVAKQSEEVAGVFDLSIEPDRDGLLARVPVEEVWGIGPNYARRLKQHGITTALALRNTDDQWIRKQMGVVGLRTVQELRGISCLPLEQCPPPKQGITCSRAFGKPITTLTEMREAVATYTARAAEKLRGEQLAASALIVFLTTNPFKDEPQYSNATTLRLPVPTDATPELLRVALKGIEAIYREGFQYKKAGVMLLGLVPVGQVQANLFDHADRERSKRLMLAVDAVNARDGADTVRFAATGLTQRWRTRFTQRSPAYTTHWNNLPMVHAN